MSKRKRIADLFCGAGGAGMGLHRAGFAVVGFDINPQPNYPFEFHQQDALTVDLSEFDAVWASPPCQAFTKYRNRRPDLPERYPNLVPAIRRKLKAAGLPSIIENVDGAPLESPAILCGSMFGLDVRRHRLFECNFDFLTPKCNHAAWEPNRFPGGRSRDHGHARVPVRATVEIGRWNIPLSVQSEAMGIEWMELQELSEAIPPAYSEFLGGQLLQTMRVPA